MRNHGDVWYEFTEKALAILRSGSSARKLHFDRAVRVLRLPTWEEWESWEVFPHIGTDECTQATVIHSVWLGARDYPNFDPGLYDGPEIDEPEFGNYLYAQLPSVPTIQQFRSVVPWTPLRDILHLFDTLRIPLTPSNENWNQDGESCELEIGSTSQSVTFSWAGPGPIEWKSLVSQTETLLKRIRELCVGESKFNPR